MPVFHLGDLVKPNPASWGQEDLDAVGIIVEMAWRSRPEAKILWNDMPAPSWVSLSYVVLAKKTPRPR